PRTHPPTSAPSPYTTLFRSLVAPTDHRGPDRERVGPAVPGDQPHVPRRAVVAGHLVRHLVLVLRRVTRRPVRDLRWSLVGRGWWRRRVPAEDLRGHPEHAGVQAVTALDLHDHVAVHRPGLLADELRLRLSQFLGQRRRVRREPAVIVR